MTATERAQLPVEELAAIQGQELNAVTTAYVLLGLLMLALLLVIRFTKMPNLSEKGEKVEFAATLRRLIRNKNYVWGVVAQFFNIGAQLCGHLLFVMLWYNWTLMVYWLHWGILLLLMLWLMRCVVLNLWLQCFMTDVNGLG